MAIADQNKINLNVNADPGDISEYVAAAAVTPGMLCEIDADGEVQPHGTAGGVHRRLFAMPNEASGKGIDDAYAINETVRVWHAPPGANVYAFLKHGTGMETTAHTTQLVSDGAGILIPADGAETDTEVVGVALTTIDNDPGSATVRCPIEMS